MPDNEKLQGKVVKSFFLKTWVESFGLHCNIYNTIYSPYLIILAYCTQHLKH